MKAVDFHHNVFFEENGIENVGRGTDLAEVFIIVVDLILNWRGWGGVQMPKHLVKFR